MPNQENERENPRTTRVRQVILDAAIQLLVQHGAGEVTATRIAEATGVARTTIYRQWPDQADLLLATVETLMVPDGRTPSTGDLDDDLRTALMNLRLRLAVREVRPVFAALVDLVSRDDAFISSQRTFITGLMQQTTDVLDAAQQRGALPDHLNIDVAAATLAGPLLHQFLVMRADVGEDLVEAVLTQFSAVRQTY